MVSFLPLFSPSSSLNTLTVNTTTIHCHRFVSSTKDQPCQAHHHRHGIEGSDRSTFTTPLTLPHHRRSNSTASWKLTQQLYGWDTMSSAMPSPFSETDLQWSYLSDNHTEDLWSLISDNDDADADDGNTHGKIPKPQDSNFPAPIQLVSRYQDTLPVLTNPMAEKIRSWLPNRLTLNRWTLLYSLDQHGASLHTFYQLVCGRGPCLLVIQDEDNNIFGAYASESIQMNTSFYGSGESFLWKQHQPLTENDRLVRYDHYPWTMKNNYFIYSDKSLFGFGNGNGQFGLCLDDGFENGTSCACPTFDNPCLSSSIRFKCIGLELWAIT